MNFETIAKRIEAAHIYHDKKVKELDEKDPGTQEYIKRLNRIMKHNSLTFQLVQKMLDGIFDVDIDKDELK